MTTLEAARRLRRSESTIQRWAESGRLRAVKRWASVRRGDSTTAVERWEIDARSVRREGARLLSPGRGIK